MARSASASAHYMRARPHLEKLLLRMRAAAAAALKACILAAALLRRRKISLSLTRVPDLRRVGSSSFGSFCVRVTTFTPAIMSYCVLRFDVAGM